MITFFGGEGDVLSYSICRLFTEGLWYQVEIFESLVYGGWPLPVSDTGSIFLNDICGGSNDSLKNGQVPAGFKLGTLSSRLPCFDHSATASL